MADLTDILSRYGADCRPTQIEPLGSAGGLSGAQFWRLVAPRSTLVLRRWPMKHPTADGLRFIHAVLRHACQRGIAILPIPIATTDGATFVQHTGHLWDLSPWLPGIADYEKTPISEKLQSAMQTLAQFHIATSDFRDPRPVSEIATTQRFAGKAPAITTRLSRLRDLQSGGIDRLAHAINDNAWRELAPLARQFVAALPRAIPSAIAKLAPLANVELPLQPCIRDIWHDHILFEGNRVTGVIDFGAMQIDTPATDVARLLGSLVGDDHNGWRNGLVAYSAARPLTEQELLAVSALHASGSILAGGNWIQWFYIDGRNFEMAQVMERFRSIVASDAISRASPT